MEQDENAVQFVQVKILLFCERCRMPMFPRMSLVQEHPLVCTTQQVLSGRFNVQRSLCYCFAAEVVDWLHDIINIMCMYLLTFFFCLSYHHVHGMKKTNSLTVTMLFFLHHGKKMSPSCPDCHTSLWSTTLVVRQIFWMNICT